jgi:plastocyanin
MRKLAGIALAALVALVAPSAASATETTYTLQVPTRTIGGYEVKQGVAQVPKPPGNGYITKMETDIVDASTGDPVPISRLMLHHIVFINVYKPDSTCNSLTLFDNRTTLGGVGLQRFYAAGEERAKLSMPPGYGYPLSAADTWAMTYMLMNHRSVPDNALIQYKVTVETDPLTPVKPYWLDVRDCRADPIYTVPGTEPPGSTHVESRDYSMPEAGRIVAGAGHVHGGARNLTITRPNCGNDQIAASNPTWGNPDHPFYNVLPILHEPGPINMSGFHSATGIPVSARETLRLNSNYDNSDPHMRVMGIFVVYIAPDSSVSQPCGPSPGDVQQFSTVQPGRAGPIPFTVPLTGLNAQGQAVTINKPPGKTKRVKKKGKLMPVGDRYFRHPNLRVKRGTSLGWEFRGNELHNLTLANGPIGIASDNLDQARRFNYRFTRPGTYRFFCSLHPVQMSQRVVVKRKKKGKRKGKERRG